MITMTFLRTWLRWLLGTSLALLGDWALVHDWLWRVGLALAAVLIFTLVTGILYGDWKRSRHPGGYRYSIVDDVTRDRT